MLAAVPLASIYFLGSAAAAFLAVLARDNRGAVAAELFGLALCVAEWSFFYGLETLSRSAAYRELWSQFAYIGTYGTVAFMLRFCIRWLTPRAAGSWMSLLWIVPFSMTAAAFTNGLHGLVWPEIRPAETIPFVYEYEHGALFWVGIAYQYLVVLVCVALVTVGVVRRRDIYRQQALLVLFGLLVAVAGNVLYVSGALRAIPLDITPLTLAIATGFLLAGISRARLLDLLPTARHRVVEVMPDGLLVLDEEARIVDWNPAALQLWGIDRTSIMGVPVADLIPPWSRIVPSEVPDSLTTTLVTERDGQTRHVDLEICRIDHPTRHSSGWIALFHDATELRSAQRRLQEANARLERLNAELAREAVHDGLTGLFNRAYLDDSLVRELARADREQRPVGLLILDVDHFKTVNDRHGHGVGDAVLRTVAELVRSQVRAGDIPCRYGGDELVAVMPGATVGEALQVGERIRRSVAQASLAAADGSVHATVSVGVGVYPDNAATAADLFRVADRALYLAKDRGRDQVCGAPDV
ncbi:MAG: diguanylate cyclase [Spirochaetota bacterium]